jgi:PAS domain S-box-containing protein
MPPADDTQGGNPAPAIRDVGEQLRELALLYDTAPIGLAFLTPDCRLVQINQQLAAIFGTSAREQFGRRVRETVPQIADEVERIVAGVLRTGEPVMGLETTAQQPDGINANRVWLTNWHPLKAADGSVLGINVVAEEITDRKRVEREMQERAAALAQTVEDQAQERERIWTVSEDLLAVADLGGRFISINPAWTTTLGWGPPT